MSAIWEALHRWSEPSVLPQCGQGGAIRGREYMRTRALWGRGPDGGPPGARAGEGAGGHIAVPGRPLDCYTPGPAMSLVIAQDICLSYGKKVLFDNESFALSPKDRIGLVGANGTGKSSLMKILAGVQHPDSGSLTYRRKARIGYLPQELAGLPEGTVVDAVMSTVPGRDALEARLRETEEALGNASDEEEQLELAQTLADLHTELDHFEEHYGRHHAERILKGLGFREADLAKPTSALSGGWRMRAALAGLLLQDPDLLLMDEPTNHLDVPTLAWFDGFLQALEQGGGAHLARPGLPQPAGGPHPLAGDRGAALVHGQLRHVQAAARRGDGAAQGAVRAGRGAQGGAAGVHRSLRRQGHARPGRRRARRSCWRRWKTCRCSRSGPPCASASRRWSARGVTW